MTLLIVDNEKCIFVLDGQLGVIMDGERHDVGPGEACFIQAFCPHRMINEGNVPAKFLIINVSTNAEPLVHANNPLAS